MTKQKPSTSLMAFSSIHKKDPSFFVVAPDRPSGANSVPPDALVGDVVYDYRGLMVCLRKSTEKFKYLILDGNGNFLVSGEVGSPDEASEAAELWIREYHAEEDEEEREFVVTSDGEVRYGYRGRIIGIRETVDFTKCFVYDGYGKELLKEVGAGNREKAASKAEAWARKEESSKYDPLVQGNSSHQEVFLKYHSYLIRIRLLANGYFEYFVCTSKQTQLTKNMLSSFELAQYCAEYWIQELIERRCLNSM